VRSEIKPKFGSNPWTANRRQALEDDIESLLGALCAKWGFCSSLSASDLLSGQDTLEADDFAEAVLVAEGMDPLINATWRRKIKRVFVERYGQSSVSMRDYKV
jgi:hypothetical protein